MLKTMFVYNKHEIMGIHRACMDLQSCATNYNRQCGLPLVVNNTA